MAQESEKARVERHLDNHTKAMSRIEIQLAGMQKTMTDVAVALTKIAALEEHKQESKKDVDNLYALNRKTDKDIAAIRTDVAVIRSDMKGVRKDTSRNTKWVEKALSWAVMAGLVASQVIGK